MMRQDENQTEGKREYSSLCHNLLQRAITEPGLLLKAYSNFHTYSMGNMLAALMQCHERGIEVGPINTFVGWQGLGRQVRKGERALWLCMPISRKRKTTDDEEVIITGFMWKPPWFVLSQTEGEAMPQIDIPAWDKASALATLGIVEDSFTNQDGNIQGYAVNNRIAISPVAQIPHKTTFHELAHVILGHTAESDFHDSELTPRNLREVEAESVALLLCETLGLTGDVIPESSARKIFGAADRILKAGRVNK